MKPVKFPHAAQLFSFCHKIFSENKGKKVLDQEVGALINYTPSDCSHWKKGGKSVKSVSVLETLANKLDVEISLLYDIASGSTELKEAYYEHYESKKFARVYQKSLELDFETTKECRKRIQTFVHNLHKKANFITPPLYIPEIMRFFPNIKTQPIQMSYDISRFLRVKNSQYKIQYKKSDLKPQIRMSIISDLARIILENERHQYPELKKINQELLPFEQQCFIASLLVPKDQLRQELCKIDIRKNTIVELSSIFWVPKPLINYQLQELIREGKSENIAKKDSTSKTFTSNFMPSIKTL